MATYKVIQDIEADDKLIGPLTLKQFIFAAIAFVGGYLSFFLFTKHAWFLAIPLLPVIVVSAFLAFPWGRDQPTEIWLLAKIRFFLKPKRRIWNQSGVQELVTITVPKKLEEFITNNLSQTEVRSRLKALADTIDSRGWAVKNVNVNLFAQPPALLGNQQSDRLIDVEAMPKDVATTDIQAADDIMDERSNPTAQHLDQMISASTQAHREQTLQRVEDMRQQAPAPLGSTSQNPPPDFWFMNEPPAGKTRRGYAKFTGKTVLPGSDDSVSPSGPLTPSESAVLSELHSHVGEPSAAYGHTKVIDPLGTPTKKAKMQHKKAPAPDSHPVQPVTQTPDPAILNLANNDDLSVATIAHEASKKRGKQPPDDGEVVISLR